MTQEHKQLLLKDLSARLPYGVKGRVWRNDHNNRKCEFVTTIDGKLYDRFAVFQESWYDNVTIKPCLFPISSMTDEDYAIYSKIWEDTGKTAYLGGCHHLICTIKAYKASNDYLLSKQYDINGLIPMGLAEDATGKNIY